MKAVKNLGLVVFFIFLFLAGTVLAQGFKVYPGAKIDDKLTKEANELAAGAGGKTPPPRATIYVTPDAFEKVKAFYKELGKEYLMPGPAGNKRILPSGKELKASFFIFDGAKDLMSSKSWCKIQRPYIGLDGKEGPDLTYIILSEKK
jgi:hypothetical protein